MNKNGLAKNWEVCKSQWADYRVELNYVVYPGIKRARGLPETVHKARAIGEEFFDKCPRIAWYSTVIRVLVIYPAILYVVL